MRGARHILLSIRALVINVFKASPTPLEKAGLTLVDRVDQIYEKVDRNTSRMAHRYLDSELVRGENSAVLENILKHNDPGAAVLFGAVAYEHLKPVVSYICDKNDYEGHFFISEMLGAISYGRISSSFGQIEHLHEIAALIIDDLLKIGMIRTSKASNAAIVSQHDARLIARLSIFSLMIWLIIERESTPQGEQALLFDCCDIAMAQSTIIDNAIDNMKDLSDIISFTSRSI